MVPPTPGLADAPYLTNETIFGLDKRPDHLIVVGSGPLGAELAQAHRRLGAKVTILEIFNFLGKDDPELTAVIRRQFNLQGINVQTSVKVVIVENNAPGVTATIHDAGTEHNTTGSHLMITNQPLYQLS